MNRDAQPLLTLEPLIEAVQDGVSRAGWALSGLQKTTSHHFEGRWEGESSRSAYLFFHSDRVPEYVSLDAFLDETSKGLKGNLALVVEGPELDGLAPMADLLADLARVTEDCMPKGYRTPITVRLRLKGAEADPGKADSEVRLKLRIPSSAFAAGAGAVSALASTTVAAFERALEHADFHGLLDGEG